MVVVAFRKAEKKKGGEGIQVGWAVGDLLRAISLLRLACAVEALATSTRPGMLASSTRGRP